MPLPITLLYLVPCPCLLCEAFPDQSLFFYKEIHRICIEQNLESSYSSDFHPTVWILAYNLPCPSLSFLIYLKPLVLKWLWSSNATAHYKVLYQWEDSFLRKPLRHTCVLAWLAQQLCFLKYPGQTRSTFGIPLLGHIFFPLGYKSSIISQVQGTSQCPTPVHSAEGSWIYALGLTCPYSPILRPFFTESPEESFHETFPVTLFSICSVLQFYKTCLLTSSPSSNPQYPNASSAGSLKLSWWLPHFWSFLTFLRPLFDQVLLHVINLAFEPITGWGFGFGNLTSEWTIWLLNCFLVALGCGFWTTLSMFWLTTLALVCWIKGIPALFSPPNAPPDKALAQILPHGRETGGDYCL